MCKTKRGKDTRSRGKETNHNNYQTIITRKKPPQKGEVHNRLPGASRKCHSEPFARGADIHNHRAKQKCGHAPVALCRRVWRAAGGGSVGLLLPPLLPHVVRNAQGGDQHCTEPGGGGQVQSSPHGWPFPA